MRKLLLLTPLLLAACMTTGHKADPAKVQSLKKGETTYSEVLQLLGKPTTESFNADGSHVLMYTYVSSQARPETFIPIVGAFVGGADVETSLTYLVFDKTGTLQTYSASNGGNGVGTGLEAYSQGRKSVSDGHE